jgi:hypothetical protein
VRSDRDRLLDMVEMCDLLIEHATDPELLATDPVVQAAAQRWIEVLHLVGVLDRRQAGGVTLPT